MTFELFVVGVALSEGEDAGGRVVFLAAAETAGSKGIVVGVVEEAIVVVFFAEG